MQTDQSTVTAYIEIEELFRNLNEMGVKMDTTTVVSKIVSSLPGEKYRAFRKAWDSVPEASQKMAGLLARLRKKELEIKQENMQKGENSKPKTSAFVSNTNDHKEGKSRKPKPGASKGRPQGDVRQML